MMQMNYDMSVLALKKSPQRYTFSMKKPRKRHKYTQNQVRLYICVNEIRSVNAQADYHKEAAPHIPLPCDSSVGFMRTTKGPLHSDPVASVFRY
jgi:hypothetical protein